MPSPMSALSFAGASAKPGAQASEAPAVDAGAGAKDKPDFGSLVKQDRKASADAARKDTHAPAREHRRPASAQDQNASTATSSTAARRAPKPQEEPLDPLAALGLPADLLPQSPTIAVSVQNPLLADASMLLAEPTPVDTAFVADGMGGSSAPAVPQTLQAAAASPLPLPADALPADAALPTDTAPAATSDAPAPAPATAAPQAEAAKPALQNLLSFAAHLATGNIAAAVPEAISLGKDVVDALRSEDGDAAAPAGNALAGIGAAPSPLGLARTATVNATDAPSADLHGGHFAEEVGDTVRWMADQKIGHAHIKITPNDLGTVEVRLRLDGDRVHADFTSAHADVRQALEHSLPKLRDMLGQHGFQLAHADVGGQQQQASSQGTGHARGDGETGHGPVTGGDADLPRPVRMTALGLLDAYA